LIEVESLRKVNQRLSELPEIKPPAHLTRRILHDATDYYYKKEKKRSRKVYLSVAATVIVIFFAGGIFVYEQENNSSSDGAGQAAVTTSAPTFDLNSESSSNGLSPWVDNNQEIHFNDRFDSESAARFDSIMNISFERLKPVQDMDRRNDRARGLHLTGSQSQ